MKLLIIKANQLGDNIVFLPVVQELVKRLGAESLTLLTSPAAAAIYEGVVPKESLWLESTAELRSAWKRPLQMARLAKRARELEPDVVLVAFDQGNVSRLLAWMSGAPVRAGVENPQTRVNACLTHRVAFAPQEAMPVRDWAAMRLVLRALGADGHEQIPALPPRPSLAHLFAGGEKPARDLRRIFFHAGASREYKRWPHERFVELANRLSDHFSVQWSVDQNEPSEDQLSAAVERVPQGSIAELVESVAGCGMFIGNNSGPMNVAVAVGTPTLIFNGPSPLCWDPIWNSDRHRLLRVEKLACQPCDTAAGPRNRCTNIHEPMACMERWTVDAALCKALKHWQDCWGKVEQPEPAVIPQPLEKAPVL